jgi:HEAT repeat protein
MLRVVVIVGLLGSLLATAGRAEDDEPQAPASSEGFQRLVDALQSGSSFKVRATAAVALGRMGDGRAIPVLAEVIKDDDSYAVRAAAAAALGRHHDAAAVPPQLEALHDGDEYVRNEASDALDRFHTAAFLFAFREALRSEDTVLRLAAVRAYGDVMREPSASAGIAAFVINALGDDDEAVAAAAETAVAAVAHERAVPLLVDGLVNGNSSVRGACARLIEKRADPRAIDPLIAIIVDTDEPEDVRRPARAALKRHAEYLDVARYAAEANGTDATVRLRALRVLAALGDAKAPALIESSLKDADASVRIAGARAAVDFGGAKARRDLEAASARETDPRSKRQLELLLKSMR